MDYPTNITFDTEDIFCLQHWLRFVSYIDMAIALPGIFLNAICALVFFRILTSRGRQIESMFLYLLAKSIVDCTQFVIIAFEPALFCESCTISELYMTKLAHLIFYTYLKNVFGIASGYLELAATFDCFVMISDILSAYRTKTTANIVIVSIGVFSCISCAFLIFRQQIQENVRSNGANSYNLIYSKFGLSFLYKIFEISGLLVRGVLFLLLLIIFNLLILLALKKSTQRRRRLQMANSAPALVRKAEVAERRKAFMIIFSGLNSFVGHMPVVVIQALIRNCWISVAYSLFYVSFVTPIFLYFNFNHAFRRHIRKIMVFN